MRLSKISLGVMVVVSLWASVPVNALWIAIDNASFEAPSMDPNRSPVLFLVDQWEELDVDAEGSQNTGVFINSPANSVDHITNAHGSQLAFLGSKQGNGLEQQLSAPYRIGYSYQLVVAVCSSTLTPLTAVNPLPTLDLALYYLDNNEPIDIVVKTVDANGLSTVELQDFFVQLGPIEPNDPWVGKPMGIAMRAIGEAGGLWNLDHVRVVETLPLSLLIENPSFELPFMDPNDENFDISPDVEGWTEIDTGPMSTGVYFKGVQYGGFVSHLQNVHEDQLAFFNSESGTALEQELEVSYQADGVYRLTVAVAISADNPPVPLDSATLDLALWGTDGNDISDLVVETVHASDMTHTELKDISVYLGPVDANDPRIDQPIGIAIRGHGEGGFWNLDNVRLHASLPDEEPNGVSDPNTLE